ncbi:polyphosphate polymerase domain-containing protein [bacterium]|nr:polyphosphate polymerase domain-containing protein [bacterium]
MNAQQAVEHHPANELISPSGRACSPVKLQERDYSIDMVSQAEIQRYVPHTLDSLSKAALMSRVDTKFLVPARMLGDLLAVMRSSYSILEIDGQRSFDYLTTYYDTAQYTHYLAHHNGRCNRFKIRKRSYVASGSSFLEVKFKDIRKRTTKSRVPCNAHWQKLDTPSLHFLTSKGIVEPDKLNAVQTGRYKRLALANEACGERLTIDCNLSFRDEYSGSYYQLGSWVVVEVKQDVMDRQSAFFAWADKQGLREISFSKYCMGVYFTGPKSIKRNNFHPVAHHLKCRQLGVS